MLPGCSVIFSYLFKKKTLELFPADVGVKKRLILLTKPYKIVFSVSQVPIFWNLLNHVSYECMFQPEMGRKSELESEGPGLILTAYNYFPTSGSKI